MRMTNPISLLFLCGFLLAGCSTVTNLTPSQHIRNDTALYPFEVEWVSKQKALLPETVKAYVIIDFDSYPMERTRFMKNRWETLVPVPAETQELTYRYKFDYQYQGMPAPRADSKLSPPYQLTIIER